MAPFQGAYTGSNPVGDTPQSRSELPAATFRTKGCTRHGHPEVTLQFTKEPPVLGIERPLLQFFEGSVAKGVKFEPGQLVQLGWATLKLAARSDGTLGVLERTMDGLGNFVESVDSSLMQVWVQREIAGSVGLAEKVLFPRHEQVATVCKRLTKADIVVMARRETTEPGDSGWFIGCTDPDHDHSDASNLEPAQLYGVCCRFPPLMQFLALPPRSEVMVLGPGRVRAQVRYDGKLVEPKAGSYLDQFNSLKD